MYILLKNSVFILLTTILLFSSTLAAESSVKIEELQKLAVSNTGQYAQFGISVAIDENVVLIGAPGHDVDGNESAGAAYIFTYNTTTGLYDQKARLVAPDAEAAESFGNSVSIDKDTVVIGNKYDNVGWQTYYQHYGSAYVFTKPPAGWEDTSQSAKLIPTSRREEQQFGHTVAVNGNTVMVGTPWDSDGSYLTHKMGSVFHYEKPVTGWQQMDDQTERYTTYIQEDNFGISIAMSGDILVVGPPYHDSYGISNTGAVYIYKRNAVSGLYDQQAKLTLSSGVSEGFGSSVAVSGDTVVVGASYHDANNNINSGAVYLFQKPDTGWNDMNESVKFTALSGEEDDWFGDSVAIDGDTVIVGAHGDDDSGSTSGSAYLFEKPLTGWITMTETIKFHASDGYAYNAFGRSVAIDKNSVVVGAGNLNGAAYIFKITRQRFSPSLMMYLLN